MAIIRPELGIKPMAAVQVVNRSDTAQMGCTHYTYMYILYHFWTTTTGEPNALLYNSRHSPKLTAEDPNDGDHSSVIL